jgi:hypothetical protein
MIAYAAVGGVVVVLLFAVWLAFRLVKKLGSAEAEREIFKMKSEQTRRANEIDEAVAFLSDEQLDRELRDGR